MKIIQKRSFFLAVVSSLVLALCVKIFGVELFRVSSSSMAPTLLPGDYILVVKGAYGYTRHSFPWEMSFRGTLLPGQVGRGDIVVFHEEGAPTNPWIKRVVGLPGERVRMMAGAVCVDGATCPLLTHPFTPLHEEVLPEGMRYYVTCSPQDTSSQRVPEEAYFVLGDARDNSKDSRHLDVGPIYHHQLLGQARWILWSCAPPKDGEDSFFSRLRWSRFFTSLTQKSPL